MGLDMFAYKTKSKIKKKVDFKTNNLDSELFHEWRKHPNLHGWMRDLYYKKGGEKDSFNCVPVKLTQEDINQLANDILDGKLPETEGFFFGTSMGDKDEENYDLEFCKKASDAIKNDENIYYTSWW